MYLHESQDDFRELVAATSDHCNRAISFVIKDYFAIMMLRELITENNALVFKGGTCLSKCYGIIDRFSEDVDMGIEEAHATEGMRKRIKVAVQTSAAKLGLSIHNLGTTKSRRMYNRYVMTLPSLISSHSSDQLIVETAVMTPAAPTKKRRVQSFIGEYCATSGFNGVIEEYRLKAFAIKANSMERTLCDKVFALCDCYASSKNLLRQSRHIYDLRKITDAISINKDLLDLMVTVREQRSSVFGCLSAHPGVCIPKMLREIVDTGVYKTDYAERTVPLLYEKLSYEQAASSLLEIAEKLEQDKRFA
jgi:hypothetical protein